MIRALLCLLLTACASGPKVYGDGRPFVYVDGQKYTVGNPTQAERDAWDAAHEKPARDEAEVAALKLYCGGAGVDSLTTIAVLAGCAGARELNPIVGAHPAPAVLAGVSGLSCVLAIYMADKSPLSRSSADAIRFLAWTRWGAAAWNLGVLSSCA